LWVSGKFLQISSGISVSILPFAQPGYLKQP
jgi:hypothetical protein